MGTAKIFEMIMVLSNFLNIAIAIFDFCSALFIAILPLSKAIAIKFLLLFAEIFKSQNRSRELMYKINKE